MERKDFLKLLNNIITSSNTVNSTDVTDTIREYCRVNKKEENVIDKFIDTISKNLPILNDIFNYSLTRLLAHFEIVMLLNSRGEVIKIY